MPIDYIPYLRKKVGHERILSVGLSCLILNEKNEILLEKRQDNGLYCRPGGSLDLGETVIEGIKREVFEETGIRLKEVSLFMILSGEKMQIHYPNGDITDYTDLVFLSHVNSKDITLKIQDGESTALEFFPLNALPPEDKMLTGTMYALRKLQKGDRTLTID